MARATRRTPAQIAQTNLDVAQRKLVTNRKTRTDLQARLRKNELQEAELVTMVEYLGKHPALATKAAPKVAAKEPKEQ